MASRVDGKKVNTAKPSLITYLLESLQRNSDVQVLEVAQDDARKVLKRPAAGQGTLKALGYPQSPGEPPLKASARGTREAPSPGKPGGPGDPRSPREDPLALLPCPGPPGLRFGASLAAKELPQNTLSTGLPGSASRSSSLPVAACPSQLQMSTYVMAVLLRTLSPLWGDMLQHDLEWYGPWLLSEKTRMLQHDTNGLLQQRRISTICYMAAQLLLYAKAARHPHPRVYFFSSGTA